MIPLDYADARAAAERGEFVGVAVGSTPNGRAVAWITFPLDEQGHAFAHHPSDTVKAAHAIGFVTRLGQVAGLTGFTPA